MKSKRITTKDWSPSTIRKILSDIVYIGHLEQKKCTKKNYKSKVYKMTDKKQRIYTYNAHEPIISEYDFNKVQENFKRCVRTSNYEKRTYLFSGMLKCEDCGCPMLRHPKFAKGKLYVYHKCRTYSQRSVKSCNHSHSIREDRLQEIVFGAIKSQIYLIAELSNVLHQVNMNDTTQEKISHLKKQKLKNLKQIDLDYEEKLQIYRDWKKDTISKQEYFVFSNQLTSRIEKLESSISKLDSEIKLYTDMKEKNLEWLKDYLHHFNSTELTRTMMLALVDNIYIKKNKSIRVVFKHSDKIEKLNEYVVDNGKGLRNVQ